MSKVIEKLEKLGYSLPAPIKPVASYVPALKIGNLVYTSGHLPIKNGKIAFEGEIGGLYSSIEVGAEAAKLCLLNTLSSINALIGDLDKIIQVVKLTGYVKSAQQFYSQPVVINGASDLLIEIFGPEIGSHTRAAIGVNELPLNSSVELDLIVQVSD